MSYAKQVNIKVVGFFILIAGILGYAYYQTHNLIMGPIVTIETPENGITFSSPVAEITGGTKNISEITINDRHIFVDESGTFKEKLLLSPGYNIITLQAKDKFGRTATRVLELVYN